MLFDHMIYTVSNLYCAVSLQNLHPSGGKLFEAYGLLASNRFHNDAPAVQRKTVVYAWLACMHCTHRSWNGR